MLLVPNAALRFNPTAVSSAPNGISIGPPVRRGSGATPTANVGRGSRQQVWTLGPNNTPRSILVTTGDTDGSLTEIAGGGIHAGLKVITGKLAAAK